MLDLSEHFFTWARKFFCMHAMCLCAQAHISARLGLIRKIKESMESGEHARPVWTHNTTQACKLACMHAMCLRARDYISAKFGRIRDIKVSIESGEHTRPVWAHCFSGARNFACMHAMCLCAYAHISANLGQILCSERSGLFSWFHRYLDHSDPTRFGRDMG